jgi:hypothetical protein
LIETGTEGVENWFAPADDIGTGFVQTASAERRFVLRSKNAISARKIQSTKSDGAAVSSMCAAFT